MNYTVRTERVSAMPIAVVRRRAAFGRLGPVVQEACGTVWNAVKAAGVKGAGRHVSVYLDCSGSQVEMEIGDTALPMTLAAVTHYVPGAEWRPRRLSPGEGALAMLSRTVPARLRPQESLKVLARAVKDAVVLEGERGEADEFATMLLNGALD